MPKTLREIQYDDRVVTGKAVLHAQVPATKNDSAYPKGFSLAAEYLWYDARRLGVVNNDLLRKQSAMLTNLSGAVAALAAGEKLDQQKMLDGIRATAAESFAEIEDVIRGAVVAAIEAQDITAEVRAGLIAAIDSVTHNNTTTIDLKKE